MKACETHCPHEIQRNTYTGGDVYSKVTKRCCHCGEYFFEEWESKPDPKHGPFGPKVMVQVRKS